MSSVSLLLGQVIAKETGVQHSSIALLRHFDSKMKAIERVGASIEEFTLTQPSDTPYDFRAPGRKPIEIVAVIVHGRLQAVYRITGIDQTGSNRMVTSPTFQALDSAEKYPAREVKRFSAEVLPSKWIGGVVCGWFNPRVGIARSNGKLFDQVKIAAPS